MINISAPYNDRLINLKISKIPRLFNMNSLTKDGFAITNLPKELKSENYKVLLIIMDHFSKYL